MSSKLFRPARTARALDAAVEAAQARQTIRAQVVAVGAPAEAGEPGQRLVLRMAREPALRHQHHRHRAVGQRRPVTLRSGKDT